MECHLVSQPPLDALTFCPLVFRISWCLESFLMSCSCCRFWYNNVFDFWFLQVSTIYFHLEERCTVISDIALDTVSKESCTVMNFLVTLSKKIEVLFQFPILLSISWYYSTVVHNISKQNYLFDIMYNIFLALFRNFLTAVYAISSRFSLRLRLSLKKHSSIYQSKSFLLVF